MRDAARSSCQIRPTDVGQLVAQRAVGAEHLVEIERAAHLVADRPPQVGLAGEVGVDRSLRHPGVAGDGLHRRPLDAVLGEQRCRRVDDRVTSLLLLLLAAQPSSCHSQIAYTIGIANAIQSWRSSPMENAQQVLDRLCQARGIPGAVFGVVDDGEVTVAVSGIANLNTGLPVVRETLFQAGSIGKSYTATAIMQLVDDGLVDLDAPLREYLPDLEFADPTVSKTLTARQVLTHTAGIDGDRLDEDFTYGRGDDCVERYVAGLTDLPLIAEPGGLWSYCNSGYVVLGRVIEVLTGMTYEKALTTRLLEPLGVKDTLFFPGDMVMHSLAVGHVREGDAPATVAPKWEMSRAAGPAGATINTTIDDLLAFASDASARWCRRRRHAECSAKRRSRAMQQPIVSCPEPELLGDGWGLGWFVRTGSATDRVRPRREHDRRDLGVAGDPGTQRGVGLVVEPLRSELGGHGARPGADRPVDRHHHARPTRAQRHRRAER